jgi:hypothetical protein
MAFRPTITRGLALSAISFQKDVVSFLSAISMPRDLYRCNQSIVKALLAKSTFREN